MTPTTYANQPTAPPIHEGPAGRAWQMAIPTDIGNHGTVAHWLICCPGSHPMWWWYILATQHLRAEDGLPAPKVHYAGATHEVDVLALDPGKPLPSLDGKKPGSWLLPLDQVHQVILGNDGQAIALTELVARACVGGVLVPDVDHRRRWSHSLAQTAEHLRLGEHPDG